MLDLGLNNEEPHSMLIAFGELSETPYCCTSVFIGVTFQPDPTTEDVYWVHSMGSEVWTDLDGDDAVRTEINGSFRKNVDGDVLFSGVLECVCQNEDALPVHNIVHVGDIVVVQSDNNHLHGYDDKNDCYIEIV